MRVTLCDVGPRDGLQNEPGVLPAATRAELARRLAAAGLPRVEVASFVDSRRVPAMAGAEEVVGALPRGEGTVFAGLVLNQRGLERALAAGVGQVHVAYPVTDSFARRNQNTTVEAGAAMATAVVAG